MTQRGENLDISAELVDARDDSHIWGQQYTRDAADLFTLQNDLAREITTALRMRLTSEDEKRMDKNSTANPEAYQDYLKGRYWWNKATAEGFEKAIEFFQQAIAKDPNYAQAYAGLADSYALLSAFGFVPPKEIYPKAKEAALRALGIDDTLAEAHIPLALIKTNDWDWSGGENEFRRAIALNPSSARAHQAYGFVFLQAAGRFNEAIAELKRALELDPLSLLIGRNLGLVLISARQYDQAIEQERKVLELEPSFMPAHFDLGWAYAQKSMYKEATSEFEKALMVAPGNPLTLSGLGYVYAVTHRRAEAQKVLDQLSELSKQKYVPEVFRAQIYVGLGNRDKAFELLEKAYEDHSAIRVTGNPAFDPLRSDPRFADLLRRMNLQP